MTVHYSCNDSKLYTACKHALTVNYSCKHAVTVNSKLYSCKHAVTVYTCTAHAMACKLLMQATYSLAYLAAVFPSGFGFAAAGLWVGTGRHRKTG